MRRRLILVLIGVLIFSAWEYFRVEFPDVAVLKSSYPLIHYEGKLTPPKVTFQRLRPSTWSGLSEISKSAIGAILVSEDWAFYQHGGFDPHQIEEAIKDDWEAKSFVRGASTITQQVARNVFLAKDKNLWRKLKELYLSIRLEKLVGKRKILETYLNVAEWGEGVYGITAASVFYFHKSPAELTAKEGAFLAMLLPSPIRYGQSFRAKQLTEYADETVRSILYKMQQAHYLSVEDRDRELQAPLAF